MGVLVSFLVVTRSNIAYSRFMQARSELNSAMEACRELVQHAVTFSRYESSAQATQWRAEVARRTVVLLRTSVTVLEYDSKGMDAWKVPELTKDEKQALLTSVGKSNERTPLVLALFLRSTIASHKEYLSAPLAVNKELLILKNVSEFVSVRTTTCALWYLVYVSYCASDIHHKAYHGLMKLISAPFPFPLVQMTRTFLFVWVFTLPFALVADIEKLPALVLLMFFITYGFIGLERVSIELDDPFGDDPNDFDVLGLAQVVFEDIVFPFTIDGKEAADALRQSIEVPIARVSKNTATRHKRYSSVDAWGDALPGPAIQVGTDRSKFFARPPRKQSPTRGTRSKPALMVDTSLDLGAVFSGETSPLITLSPYFGHKSLHSSVCVHPLTTTNEKSDADEEEP
eukprot:CAMPEP_0118679270 /NCGR_PEP_ID=MMETSP0800-20121206/3696_1 /TAXON_ID=210618 ORGANISM="Striatella unipunctata, Strain CCMP2910" /NCGR_SAMPLE_ID=MMETSP0800 /ASSEMBLY_ACC=CAM_ASM_000638 /LENGTH=399 /DNA_ID=CAMNT_0006575249 /DNA_START=1379 /DNA_END=2579 /DNA_ORIENTATION=+